MSLNIHEIRILYICTHRVVTDILIFGHKLQTAEKKIAGLRVINSCPATLSVTLSNARPTHLNQYVYMVDYFMNIIDDRYTLSA